MAILLNGIFVSRGSATGGGPGGTADLVISGEVVTIGGENVSIGS